MQTILIAILLLALTGCEPSSAGEESSTTTNTVEQPSPDFAEFEKELRYMTFSDMQLKLERAHGLYPKEAEELWLPAALSSAAERSKAIGGHALFSLATDEDLRAYLTNPPPIWSPLVREVQIRPTEENLKLLAAAEGTTALRSIHMTVVGNCEDGAQAVAKAKLPALERLAFLVMQDSTPGSKRVRATEGAKALAQSPNLRTLEHLDMSGCLIGVEGAKALAGAKFASIRELVLNKNEVGDDGAIALMKSPFLIDLERAELSQNGITDNGFASLQDAWKNAKVLTFRFNGIELGSAGSALSLRNNTALEVLDLAKNPLGEGGVFAVARAPLPSLRELDLSDTEAGKGLIKLIEGAKLPHLTMLDVSYNGLGDAAAKSIASANLPKLEVLRMSHNSVGDTGTLALATSKTLGLKELDLLANQLTSAGAKKLASVELSPNLSLIRVSGKIDCPAVEALWSAKSLARLVDVPVKTGLFVSSESCRPAQRSEMWKKVDPKFRMYQH